MGRDEFITVVDNSIKSVKKFNDFTCNILWVHQNIDERFSAETRDSNILVATYKSMFGFHHDFRDRNYHLHGRLVVLLGFSQAVKINLKKERIALLEQFKKDCLEEKLYEVF